jgi:hypothetical protein
VIGILEHSGIQVLSHKKRPTADAVDRSISVFVLKTRMRVHPFNKTPGDVADKDEEGECSVQEPKDLTIPLTEDRYKERHAHRAQNVVIPNVIQHCFHSESLQVYGKDPKAA